MTTENAAPVGDELMSAAEHRLRMEHGYRDAVIRGAHNANARVRAGEMEAGEAASEEASATWYVQEHAGNVIVMEFTENENAYRDRFHPDGGGSWREFLRMAAHAAMEEDIADEMEDFDPEEERDVLFPWPEEAHMPLPPLEAGQKRLLRVPLKRVREVMDAPREHGGPCGMGRSVFMSLVGLDDLAGLTASHMSDALGVVRGIGTYNEERGNDIWWFLRVMVPPNTLKEVKIAFEKVGVNEGRRDDGPGGLRAVLEVACFEFYEEEGKADE